MKLKSIEEIVSIAEHESVKHNSELKAMINVSCDFEDFEGIKNKK